MQSYIFFNEKKNAICYLQKKKQPTCLKYTVLTQLFLKEKERGKEKRKRKEGRKVN